MITQEVYSLERVTTKGTPIFLAGPIAGATTWRKDLIKSLQTNSDYYGLEICIFNPEFRNGKRPESKNEKTALDWEEEQLKVAATKGNVAIWFGGKRENYQGNFGINTLREIGLIKGWRDYDPEISCVIGIDPIRDKNIPSYEIQIRSLKKSFGNNLRTATGIEEFATAINQELIQRNRGK